MWQCAAMICLIKSIQPPVFTTHSMKEINSFVLHRCLQDGTLDDQGAYMRIDYDVTVTSLNNHNAKNLSVQYKKRSDQSYTTQAVSLTAYTQSGNVVITADTNSTYDVALVLADDFATITIELQLSTAFATMNFKRGGDGIAIGKVAEYSKVLEVAAGWSLRIGNTTLSEAELAALKALIQ